MSLLASSSFSHNRAVLVMICAATLWSIAGVLTRHLEVARGFEVTFWRSLFAAVFVVGALLWQKRGRAVANVLALGPVGLLSGLMWAVMFCCFMIALTMTTVANTLVVMSISPLLTALLAWALLRQKIAARTWLAIAVAFVGMVWMFVRGMAHVSAGQLLGMGIALGVPLASSINVIVLKKAGARVDLIPAVLVGGLVSALLMLPLSLPMQASAHDIGILAILGFFQLGFPCMLMVAASRSLAAPEIALLALIEVLLGPIWAWLGAGEVPANETLAGGALVVAALVFNELVALRRPANQASAV
ncbi:drug/metabolite transporter (DMT)-like permease [Actimicrobium sp. GrIS 1.19]|uniref:DMT family transporter n=1 Tax=Actimicrobium sp. GrIS 1.19 TaxID=3071708 RepID=UPI002E03205C|nr:drug/metabolite transporter (DMT)-like permease [Actimicrobium sp. GrIS 1.19]